MLLSTPMPTMKSILSALSQLNTARINAKDALITGFYDLVQLRDSYVHHSKVYGGPHKELIDNYMKAQALLLSPIAPHTCEHLWKLLGQTGFIVQASWPERKSLDPSLLEKYAYMQNHIKAFRQKLVSIALRDFSFLSTWFSIFIYCYCRVMNLRRRPKASATFLWAENFRTGRLLFSLS